jgi:hypothetical protein
MKFSCLEQRMAQSYLDLLPKFIPDENAKIGISEQEEFYLLIKSLYTLAFDEPLLFVPLLHEDDAFPNVFNKTAYKKPELLSNMRKFTKTVDTILQNMYLAGQKADVKMNKRQNEILAKLRVNDLSKLPTAWTWMANRSNSNIIEFMHCLFNRNYPYTSDIYANLLGETAFRKLENWMFSKGYKTFDLYDVTASCCKLSLTYANPLWDKTPPNGGFEYKIRHTGISIRYEREIKEPVIFGLCIPKNIFKILLTDFNTMGNDLQQFIISRTKICNGCKYCIQTDKTNTRPFAIINVNYEKKSYQLCTYFPGYNYCWKNINDGLVEQLICMLSFMDKYVPNNKKNK